MSEKLLLGLNVDYEVDGAMRKLEALKQKWQDLARSIRATDKAANKLLDRMKEPGWSVMAAMSGRGGPAMAGASAEGGLAGAANIFVMGKALTVKPAQTVGDGDGKTLNPGRGRGGGINRYWFAHESHRDQWKGLSAKELHEHRELSLDLLHGVPGENLKAQVLHAQKLATGGTRAAHASTVLRMVQDGEYLWTRPEINRLAASVQRENEAHMRAQVRAAKQATADATKVARAQHAAAEKEAAQIARDTEARVRLNQRMGAQYERAWAKHEKAQEEARARLLKKEEAAAKKAAEARARANNPLYPMMTAPSAIRGIHNFARGAVDVGVGLQQAAFGGMMMLAPAMGALQMTGRLETGTALTAAVMGVGPEKQAQIARTYRELSLDRSVPISATQIQEAGQEIARAGITDPDKIKSMIATVGRAYALDPSMSIGKMVERLVALSNAFGKGGGTDPASFNRMASLVVTASNLDPTTAPNIINAASLLLGSAKGYGLSAEQTIGLISTLQSRGLNATLAGTNMSRLIQRAYEEPGGKSKASQQMAYAQKKTGINLSAYDAKGNRMPFEDRMRQISQAYAKLTPQEQDRFRKDVFAEQGGRAFQAMMAQGGFEEFVTSYKTLAEKATPSKIEESTKILTGSLGEQMRHARENDLPTLIATGTAQVIGETTSGKGLGGLFSGANRAVGAYAALQTGGDTGGFSEDELRRGLKIKEAVSGIASVVMSATESFQTLFGIASRTAEAFAPLVRGTLQFYAAIAPLAGPVMLVGTAIRSLFSIVRGGSRMFLGAADGIGVLAQMFRGTKSAAEGAGEGVAKSVDAVAQSGTTAATAAGSVGRLKTVLGALGAIGAALSLGVAVYEIFKVSSAADVAADRVRQLRGEMARLPGPGNMAYDFDSPEGQMNQDLLRIYKGDEVYEAEIQKAQADLQKAESEKPESSYYRDVVERPSSTLPRLRARVEQLRAEREEMRQQGRLLKKAIEDRGRFRTDGAKPMQPDSSQVPDKSEVLDQPDAPESSNFVPAEPHTGGGGGGGGRSTHVNIDGRRLLTLQERTKRDISERAGSTSTPYQMGLLARVGTVQVRPS